MKNTINTELMMLPYSFQISSRIADLINYYSRSELDACLLCLSTSKQTELKRHIDNLYATYTTKQVNDVLKLFKLQTKRKAA